MGNKSVKELREERAKIKAELENRTFAERYELAAKQWYENTGVMPPTYKDPETGKLYWVNRAQRRKNKK